MAYIGNTPTTQLFTPAIDFFDGDNSTRSFTLSRTVATIAQVQVFVGSAIQNPSSAYSVTGNILEFTVAPAAGSNNIFVYYTSLITETVVPAQGTIGSTQLMPDSITQTSMAPASIGTLQIQNNAVGVTQLQPYSISANLLVNNSITASTLQSNLALSNSIISNLVTSSITVTGNTAIPNKTIISASGQLQILNNARTTVLMNLDDTGNLTALLNLGASSDIRLKENIRTLPNALKTVTSMRGVSFNRNDIESRPKQIGVIAQEVQKIVPEVVMTDSNGMLSVAYGNLVGLLIEAIKELSAEVDKLKGQIK